MTITPRSLAIGLGAWCLAFLVAYCGNINPVHLTVIDVACLGASLLLGILALRFGLKRFCRSASESGAAIMTFAVSWFAGLYVPIAAIWANAPFCLWVNAQKVPPHGDVLSPWLVPAIEKSAAAHFLGVAIIFIVGFFVMRRTRMTIGSRVKNQPAFNWNLDRIDARFGIATLMLGLGASIIGLVKLTDPAQGFACAGGAFLLCFVFRSLRLQRAALQKHIPKVDGPALSKRTRLLCAVALWLYFVALAPLTELLNLSLESCLLTSILLSLTPWFIYRMGRGRVPEAVTARSHAMNHFAVRCGIWFWLGGSLVTFGLVLPGIAVSEMNKAGAMATPFALTVVSLKPIFCVFALPAAGAVVGSIVLMWALPRWASVSERVLACAQAGAVGLMIGWVLGGLLAASLTFSVAAFDPNFPNPAIFPHFREGLVEGHWIPLTRLSMIILGFVATWGAITQAAEATFECGLEWAVGRLKR